VNHGSDALSGLLFQGDFLVVHQDAGDQLPVVGGRRPFSGLKNSHSRMLDILT